MAIASVSLGIPVPTALRCSKAEPSDVETAHEFQTLDAGGTEAFITVRTSCPKMECKGEEERTVISVEIRSTLQRKTRLCSLPTGISPTTSRGLRLGATVADVVRFYGRPIERSPRKGSPNIFDYAGRLADGSPMGLLITFKAGRVAAVLLYVNEDVH